MPRPSVLLAAWLVFNALVVGVWDLYCVFFRDPEDTVSWTLQTWFTVWPMSAILMGILIGHLGWPMIRAGAVVQPAKNPPLEIPK